VRLRKLPTRHKIQVLSLGKTRGYYCALCNLDIKNQMTFKIVSGFVHEHCMINLAKKIRKREFVKS